MSGEIEGLSARLEAAEAGHAQEARRNLPTCQGCHADGQICLTCHSARTGLRVNPHPDNWGDIKDRINKAAGQRTCVKCH